MQWIRDWALHRLVMFRERTVIQSANWNEQPPHALGIHDEWPHVIFGIRVSLEIGNVNTRPGLLGFVPPYLAPRRIDRFASEVTRSAVVQHPAIHGPRPTPVRVNTQVRGIFGSTTLQERAGFGPRTAINPVAARRGAVVL